MPGSHRRLLRQSATMTQTYILTLSCPDRLGLVHAVSGFLLEHGCNIEEAAQYNDQGTGLFFMRVQFSSPTGDAAPLRGLTRGELNSGSSESLK